MHPHISMASTCITKQRREVVREEYYQVLEMIVVAKTFGPQEKERDQRRRFLYMALVCRPAVTRACKGLQSRPANTEAADTRSCFDQCMFQSIRTCQPDHCFLVSETFGSLSPFAEWCGSIRSLRPGCIDSEGLALTKSSTLKT